MHSPIRYAVALALWLAPITPAFAQHPTMPPGVTHDEHQAQMQKDAELKRRGAAAMGFDQDKTTHHFRLSENGGTIEVIVKDSKDRAVLAEVRGHLQEIAAEFARGQFGKPFATHGETPPGVAIMQDRIKAITFRYEDMASGGRVRIVTSDAKAKAAVQEFLRYQIREHATGDPLTVKRR
jgi:hypothetical protein